jgi:predicted PurR-regulated permease PerM
MEVEDAKETQEGAPAPEFMEQTEFPALVAESARKPRPRLSAIAVVGTFVLGTIAFLYFAKVFFLPLTLALLLSFLLKPLVKGLEGWRVPQSLGAALVLLALLVGIGHGVTLLSKPASDLISKMPDMLREAEYKVRHLLRRAEQLSNAAAQVQDMTKATPEQRATPKVEVRPGLADTALTATTSFLAGALETVVLLYFLLAYGDRSLQKVVKVLPNFREKKEAVTIARELQQNISAFLLTITLINACLGLLVGLGVWLVELSNPILWGVAAALLNFIPYFGPILGVSILALAGLLTFESVGRGLAPPLLYLSLHALESNFITPMSLGRRLTLNPLVIFISLMFWTWLWGIPGALLSVPLLMILKILCDHFKPLAPIGEFLSG